MTTFLYIFDTVTSPQFMYILKDITNYYTMKYMQITKNNGRIRTFQSWLPQSRAITIYIQQQVIILLHQLRNSISKADVF